MKNIAIIFLLLFYGFVSATEITHPGSFRNGYIENKGQIIDQNNQPNPAVKYLFNGNGLNVQLRANGFSYDTYSITRSGNSQVNSPIGITDKFNLPDTNCMYHFHRVDIEFIGANPALQIIAEQPSNYYFNYYTTGTPEEGVTNVRTYQSVTYKNLYEGIDLEFSLNPSQAGKGTFVPKYNFIIHPGADASQIKWKYNGAFSTSMQEGKIILSVESGNLEEQLPASFVNETSEKMNVNYLTSADHVYSFAVPSYNKNSTLIIDPLPWATYFGGTGITNGYSIGVDTANNVISTGFTNSTTSIATTGAFQTSFGGGSYDAFIFKQNDSGSCLWATYYGGPGWEFAESIGTDVSGNIMIAGFTNSAIGIATPGTQQYVIGGGWDAFAAKFSPSGGRIWGTYFGGDAEDRAFAMAINPAGGFCITGCTFSGGLATGGAYQTSISGSPSAFIAKFTASGILTWSTYYGGGYACNTQGFGVFIDANGNVLVTGVTGSFSTGLGSIGAYQTTSGGASDAFIVKFNPSGSTRLWGTYFGGSGNDYGQSITCDSNFNVIVTGYTGSLANISTPGAAQTTYGGSSEDCFVAKFDSSGTTQWATYIGGSGLDRGYGVATDSSGNIFVCGVTGSSTNIATTGSFQPNFGGPLTSGFDDIFIEKYNASGYRLWGTYYGGSGYEFASSIALDKNKNILITGNGGYDTSAGITTFGAYQRTNNGVNNAIVASFTGNGMLPVKLLSFTAKEMGRTTDNTHVLLQWQTASEVNNDHFDVERSYDGRQFTEIGNVKACLSGRQGNGTSHSLQNYQFTDNCPIIDHDGPTALYYQLKQIDNDGKYTYSNVVCVQLTLPNLTDIVIMPNPSKGVFNITRSNDKGDVSIDIFDLIGHKVCHAPTIPEQMQIDLSEWGRGIYFIRFSSGDSTSIRKIVIE